MGRLLSIGIVVFWAVMSTAHLKRVWFPSVEFEKGPPAEELLWRFLSLEDSNHNLEVFHRDEWVGVVNVSSRGLEEGEGGAVRRALDIRGTARLPLAISGGREREDAGIRALLTIREGGVVESVNLILRLAKSDLLLEADFDASGDASAAATSPADRGVVGTAGRVSRAFRYRVHQGDVLLVDTGTEGSAPTLSPSLLWLGPLLEAGPGGGASDGVGVRSEGVHGLRTRRDDQKLAGRRRTVYVVEPEVEIAPPPFEIHLTEGGEIVRIKILGDLDLRSVLVTMSQGA